MSIKFDCFYGLVLLALIFFAFDLLINKLPEMDATSHQRVCYYKPNGNDDISGTV